ncbi:unnamed protein product [Rhodiola kirilowii]
MPMLESGDGGNGLILDLSSAVKDGVLGGVEGVNVGDGAEKLNLRMMIEELDLAEIPPVFICPISLEPMQEPVTLCTGQTYERSNILKWFSLGHFTCPTTMQELWDDSVTSNTTLSHLIYIWFSQKYLIMKKRSEDVQGRVSELIKTLRAVKEQARVQGLKELRQVVEKSITARRTLVSEGGIALLLSLLGPFTSHTVGSEIVATLVILTLDSESISNLLQPAKVSLLVDLLNEGSIHTKINCTRLMETLVEEKDFRSEIVSSHRLLIGLMRLVKDKRNPNGMLHGLRLLRSICSHNQVLKLIITIGAVSQLVNLLPSLHPDSLELALPILDALASHPEGVMALKKSSSTIPHMVKLLMRVSEPCTQHALSILWSVCQFALQECSATAIEAGIAARLLLVIQSGCSPIVKQKSAELLKLCSSNYSDTIFISKCKLTRTIQ